MNSGILFLTSIVIIPLLIYLFAKKKPHRVIFSSIRFIKESQQKQRRKINLKNLLLLIIRMLIILFIILAISRPAIKAPFLKKGTIHPKTAIAIIIDNSYSMNYLVDTQTEMEKAKIIINQINKIISDNDQIIVLTLDDDWNRLNSSIIFGKIPDDLINNIKITTRAKSLEEILKLADSKLKEAHLPNKEIYFITDLQQKKLPEKMEIPTFFIPTSKEKERNNLSCQNTSVVNEIVKKDLEKKITFEIVNHSSRVQQDVIFQLFLDGNTIAEKVTDLQPNQRKTESFTINLERAGWHSGYVEVKNERQTFDNRNYFSFLFNPNPKVAILTDDSKMPLALETILEIYTQNPENINLFSYKNLSYELLKNYENIIVYKKFLLSNKLQFILDKLQEENKGILFIADKNLIKEWQEYLEEIFKTEFKEFLHSKQNLHITYANKYHPVTLLLKSIGNARINDFWSVSSRSNILLQTQEFPIALENKGSCLWLFDTESLQNPFLLDSAFPIFAYNTLQFLAGSKFATNSKKVGNKIRLDSNFIELPNGNSIQVNKNYYRAFQPGIFKTKDRVIAVNLDYAESDYKRFSKPDVKNLKILDEKWQDNFLQSRYGFEVWKYLLLFVLILFALEMFIIKKEENK